MIAARRIWSPVNSTDVHRMRSLFSCGRSNTTTIPIMGRNVIHERIPRPRKFIVISYRIRLFRKYEEEHHHADEDKDNIRLHPSGLKLPEQYPEKSRRVRNSIHQ